MRCAVIGGGIFGVTSALKLAAAGHAVVLFEKESDILQAASGINQYRLHRGYHYPRSHDTIASCLTAEPLFRMFYDEAVMLDEIDHYYCIARQGSFVSGDEYIAVCDQHGLEYERRMPPVMDQSQITLSIKVREALIDPVALRRICHQRLRAAGVELRCGQAVTLADVADFDRRVLALYAASNMGLPSDDQRAYQFELCEKLVVQLPASFAGLSVVIMDGPFTCIDPFGRTGYHVMGNVVHAIHATNVGPRPEIPDDLASYLNQGVIEHPARTNFERFMETARQFMPSIVAAEHIGSMYTVRTVLPRVEATDERPTLVRRLDERTVQIFSGKFGNCVEAANRVVELMK